MTVNRESLDAAVATLRLTLEATPARRADETVEALLGLVNVTFHEYVVAVLEEPMPSGMPDGSPSLAMRAALHARAIADLLTALAVAYWTETGDGLSAIGKAEAPTSLTRRWIDEMAEAVHLEDGGRHDTGVEYVRGAALTMSFIARILANQQGLSLDRADPRGPVQVADDAMTGDHAGAMLIWCGSAALRIAATLQPQFRIQGSPGEMSSFDTQP